MPAAVGAGLGSPDFGLGSAADLAAMLGVTAPAPGPNTGNEALQAAITRLVAAKTADGRIPCPVCDKSFTARGGILYHLEHLHGTDVRAHLARVHMTGAYPFL